MRHGTTTTFGVFLATLVVAAAPATAANPTPSAGVAKPACSTSQAFSRFGDQNAYAQLINGTLESGPTAFQASGKPAIVTVNEKYYLHASVDKQSLQLSAGDSVRFHAGCLPTLNPAMRFVARAVGSGTGTLAVQVQYQDASAVVHVISLGTLDAASYSDWMPTPQLTFLNSSASLSSQVNGNVWLILTPSGTAKWQVDDLYIDPYHSR